MKKIFPLILLILCLQGCYNKNANLVEITFPNRYVKFQIHDSYNFIVEGDFIAPESRQVMGLHSSDSFIVYGKTDLSNYITSGVIIKKSSLLPGSNWSPSIFKPANFALEKGITTIGDLNFKYSIFATPVSSIGQVSKAVIDSGFLLPDLLLVQNLREVFDDKEKTLLDIYYFGDISEHNYGYSWRGPELIGKVERRYMKHFKKQASEVMHLTQNKE